MDRRRHGPETAWTGCALPGTHQHCPQNRATPCLTRSWQMAHGRGHGHVCGRSRAATTGCRSRTLPVSAGTDADVYLAPVPRPSARHGSGIPVAFFPVNARDSKCAGLSADCRDSATGCNRDTEHAPEAADCTSLNGRRTVIPFRGMPPRLLHRFRSRSQPPRTVTAPVQASGVGVAFQRATSRCCEKEMRH